MRRPVLKDFRAAKESVAWSDDCHCLLDDNLQKRSKETCCCLRRLHRGHGITIDPRAAHVSSHEPDIDIMSYIDILYCANYEALMSIALQAMIPVADAIAIVLRPYAEVVLHDLEAEEIAYIANPISRRAPGDSSLTDLIGVDVDGCEVIGPYPKTNPDGRSLKSITAILRDKQGQPYGLLCINIDVSMFETLESLAKAFLRLDDGKARPSALFEKDWREEANEIIGKFLADRGEVARKLSYEDRLQIIGELDVRGLFNVRNAVPYIARLLGVSRATLYKSLKDARK